ncbi:hypothetical protein [Variovorax sp. N23]|uniref:hypothetical protein n=1 Tax=Variovorax sp. N23 TaxID=2980555 RepID=UPI003966D58D
MPEIMLRNVVLPLPEGPTRNTISPKCALNPTLSPGLAFAEALGQTGGHDRLDPFHAHPRPALGSALSHGKANDRTGANSMGAEMRAFAPAKAAARRLEGEKMAHGVSLPDDRATAAAMHEAQDAVADGREVMRGTCRR